MGSFFSSAVSHMPRVGMPGRHPCPSRSPFTVASDRPRPPSWNRIRRARRQGTRPSWRRFSSMEGRAFHPSARSLRSAPLPPCRAMARRGLPIGRLCGAGREPLRIRSGPAVLPGRCRAGGCRNSGSRDVRRQLPAGGPGNGPAQLGGGRSKAPTGALQGRQGVP